MNYVPPTNTRPILLSLNEKRQLFHELGHVLHALFTQTKYATLYHVDRDFVEAPSMMLEQFFWEQRHIKQVSYHYSYIDSTMMATWKSTLQDQDGAETREMPVRLGDDVVRDLARTNQGKVVQNSLADLFFATYDLLVHTPASREALEQLA